jgi:tetratricopeptide (TPR) repeat protein
LWEVSRQAVVERHCRELSRAQALLLRAPQQALERAQALLAQAPALAEARVLRGRASLRVGNVEQALADLLPLIAEGAPPVADPAALLDGGRAALARGDLASAGRFYRQLGSRAALLPTRAEQTVAYIEIAGALLATDAAATDDVLAYLREAKRRSSGTGYSSLVTALTAVAWIASGREAEGQGSLSELGDPWALRRFETLKEVSLPQGLIHAVLGLVFERDKGDQSATHYRALAESPLRDKPVGKIGARRRELSKRGGK